MSRFVFFLFFIGAFAFWIAGIFVGGTVGGSCAHAAFVCGIAALIVAVIAEVEL